MTEEYPIYSPRKLIEVALPLDAINAACVKDKNPFLKCHPRAIHLWWARRPLAAVRAVIFAQMVNDPGYQQGSGFKYGMNKKEATKERKRLFDIIQELVLWENLTDEIVLEKARAEIRRSWKEVCELNKNHPQAADLFNANKLPDLHDPFAGGGAIPLEAQRLGIKTFATDLNPVPVLINKAMVELPPKFASIPPLKPSKDGSGRLVARDWTKATGLAEDIRFYSNWIREQLENRIVAHYPTVTISKELAEERSDLEDYVGQERNVVAWLWARTVKSPNPAFSHVDIPLLSTFVLSRKKGREAYLEPVINGDSYEFVVRQGKSPGDLPTGTKLGRGCKFRCLLSNTAIPEGHIKAEISADRSGFRLLAIVVDGERCKLYVNAIAEHESIAQAVDSAEMAASIHAPIADDPRNLWCVGYGVKHFDQLYTPRQMLALSTISDLIQEVRQQVLERAQITFDVASGIRPEEYANAIAMYLACGLSQLTRYSCVNCSWNVTNENVVQAFGRQAIPMTWDFAEAHPFRGALSIDTTTQWVADAIGSLQTKIEAVVVQHDARSALQHVDNVVVSTDPPYYDNISYADLSDFFYVWLRRTLRGFFPGLFATISVPKSDELIAATHRHGDKNSAEMFFLDGMTIAMRQLAKESHPAFPLTIYYAFKQSETKKGVGTSSTGWETFLDATIQAGLRVCGTWPMRTEKVDAYKKVVNALASSIVLVCRPRAATAPTVSRREFIRELDQTLPEALDDMTRGIGDEQSPVAPVDLSQAIIGPGMAVFSKYSAVLEADGEPMTVRTALQLINRFLAEDDFDKDTQFCLHWFEQYGWDEGLFGEADVLARAKATAVDALDEAGVIQSGGGKVKLLRWSEYPTDWDPTKDSRTPVWEALHHLIRGLKQGGESEAGRLLAGVQSQAEAARQLAYRLYTLCERKGWAEDAGAYNELITSWSGIETATPRVEQGKLF